MDSNTSRADPYRALAADLKEQIMAVIDEHPAKERAAIVYAALVELALTVGVNTFGNDARKYWVGAFGSAEFGGTPNA